MLICLSRITYKPIIRVRQNCLLIGKFLVQLLSFIFVISCLRVICAIDKITIALNDGSLKSLNQINSTHLDNVVIYIRFNLMINGRDNNVVKCFFDILNVLEAIFHNFKLMMENWCRNVQNIRKMHRRYSLPVLQ